MQILPFNFSNQHFNEQRSSKNYTKNLHNFTVLFITIRKQIKGFHVHCLKGWSRKREGGRKGLGDGSSGGRKSPTWVQGWRPCRSSGWSPPAEANCIKLHGAREEQELSYRQQIASQLRTQYAEGIYRLKYYTVTLKSRLRVTQGKWKRNHWIDHTRLIVVELFDVEYYWPWNAD